MHTEIGIIADDSIRKSFALDWMEEMSDDDACIVPPPPLPSCQILSDCELAYVKAFAVNVRR